MSNNSESYTCPLCESAIDPDERAPTYLDQPPGCYIDEALDELRVNRSAQVCVRCWLEKVHTKAWELAKAEG